MIAICADGTAEGDHAELQPEAERLAACRSHGAVIGEYHGSCLNPTTQAEIAGKSARR